MSFISNPKKLTPPDEPFYPMDRLWLFERYNRLSWEQSFGEQAPPWDSQRRIKRWADTSVLDGVGDPETTYAEYDYFDLSSRSFKKMRLSVREASLPNLPGQYVHPAYIIQPTPAVMNNPDGGQDGVNPKFLCYRAEAEEVGKELGASAIMQNTSFDEGLFSIDWRGEQRRMWLIRFEFDLHSAAALVQAKWKNGIGAPGEWKTLDSGQPVWISHQEKTGDRDPRPEVPVPCRRLADNEALYLGHPMKVVVYRRDIESEYNEASSGDGAAFPPDLRTTLERIDASVQQLLALSITSRG